MTCSLLLDMGKINTSVTRRSFILFFEAFFSSGAVAKLAKLWWRIMVLSLPLPPCFRAIYGIKHVWISKPRLLHPLAGFVSFLWADCSFNFFPFLQGGGSSKCEWGWLRVAHEQILFLWQGHGCNPPGKSSLRALSKSMRTNSDRKISL